MGNYAKRLCLSMFGHKRFSREGGVEVVVEELSTRMVRLGHQVTCYNRGGHHVSGKEFDGAKLHEYKGVKLKTVPTINVKGLAQRKGETVSEKRVYQNDKQEIDIFEVYCGLADFLHFQVVVTIHGACEIIETTGKKPGKSRGLAA